MAAAKKQLPPWLLKGKGKDADDKGKNGKDSDDKGKGKKPAAKKPAPKKK